MSWKEFFSYVIPLLLIVLLFFYWVLPLETIDFGASSSRNSNFTLNNYSNKSMQFYDNMRYPSKDISYNIQGCTLKKKDDMERSFEIIENLTVLNFYPVTSDEEISVTCDEKARFEGDLFIAGEGGPTKITQSENFNVIHKGGILLIRESKCENPNVGIHELLHALGFDHSDNPNNILYPISKCSQEIGQDTIDMINWLYSFPSLPDLMLENVSATMEGRYLDLNLTVRNAGLNDAPEAKIEVYADGKLVQEINFDLLDIGNGRRITMNNIFILQKSINELRFLIKADFEELEKENNEVILDYNN
ncbi:MAG: CARDB domain-containing protein [Nanoarchaeota archaeon]|mgnify:FL=1